MSDTFSTCISFFLRCSENVWKSLDLNLKTLKLNALRAERNRVLVFFRVLGID